MSEPLRIGLIGCGPRGLRGHVPGIRECSDASLVAICDRDAELANRTAAELGATGYADHRAMLAHPDLEAVVIVTATPHHSALAMAALEAGKHVLLEKPMATSVDEAIELQRRAQNMGLIGAIGYQYRFYPGLCWLVEQGRRLEAVQALINRPRGMLASKYLAPGPDQGVLDYISHDLDLAMWLMGGPPLYVTAVLQQGLYSDTGAYENASILLEFEGRRTVTVQSTICAGGLATRFEVIGRHGSAGFSGEEGVLARQVPDPTMYTGYRSEVEHFDLPGDTGLAATAAMHAAFARAVRTGHFGTLASFEHGVRAMRLHEAVVEADRRGEKLCFE
ncbi:MAG: Gfo/Idh/MocA family protein [Armatimonadota bacterium]